MSVSSEAGAQDGTAPAANPAGSLPDKATTSVDSVDVRPSRLLATNTTAGTAAPPGGLGDVLTAGAMSVLMVVSFLMALMLCGCVYFSWRSFYNNGKGDDIPEASFVDDEGE